MDHDAARTGAALARAELAACLARVAARDPQALAELYQRMSAKLFGICLRILGERAAAEDVLQEVFLAVWNKADRFDSARGISPVTWLAVLARNRALDRLRGQKTRRFSALDEAAEIADAALNAEALLGQAQDRERLRECLRGLDARAGNAIRDAFFGGQTYQKLAAQAGMPLATMKTLIRRALIQLKYCLGHD